MKQHEVGTDASIHVQSVGGIEETTIEFSPGVTLLVGRNATNRTSLLRGLMAAMGSDDVSIKADSDKAAVELEIGGGTYTRELVRRSNEVVTAGQPYLEDPMLADLFAFLLESNEARQAVSRSDDLHDLIMRPVDTDMIQAEIDRLLEERKNLDSELDEIDSLKGELPDLEKDRSDLESKIEEKKRRLEAKEAELESANTDVEAKLEEKAELEETLNDLRDKRSELDDVRYDIETERESLETLRSERLELEADIEDLPESGAGELADIDAELSGIRDRKQRLERQVNELQNVVGFNEELLEGANRDVFETLGMKETDDSVTDQLLDGREVNCWTCGTNVEASQIESTIDQLRDLSREKLAEVRSLDDEIADLKNDRRTLEQSQRKHERINDRLSDVEGEIERTEESIDRLQDRRNALTEEIESIEAQVEDVEDDSFNEVLELHKEANRIEYELGRMETDLEHVEERIEAVEERIATEDTITAQREELTGEIENLRTRIERVEQSAIEEFNDRMEEVLELLEYENLDRIWLERVEREGREGRRTTSMTVFELHVIRSTESGTAYEDTVAHLSESEREVTGLVFALAGYLVHEVYEAIPFMLLDSLESIDSERIAALVDYLEGFADYLIVALLPEDAAALSDEYLFITEI